MEKITVLLPSTQGKINVIGDPIKANGWYGMFGIHTISISTVDLRGRVFIQASLANNPSDDDWFPIFIEGNEYIEFPQNPLNPTGILGDTGVYGYTFNKNILWIRAILNRDYFIPDPDNYPEIDIPQLGIVSRILIAR